MDVLDDLRDGERTGRVTSRVPTVPSSGSTPYAGSDGAIPRVRASFCESSPHFSYVACEPRTRKRGAGSQAIRFIQSRERTPDACSRETNASPSASASRGSEWRAVSPCTSTVKTKKLQRLVDEVRPQVREDASAAGPHGAHEDEAGRGGSRHIHALRDEVLPALAEFDRAEEGLVHTNAVMKKKLTAPRSTLTVYSGMRASGVPPQKSVLAFGMEASPHT